MGGRRFHHRLPPHTTLVRWQRERPWLVVGIEQHEECLVQEWLPLRVFFLNGMAVQPYAKAADIPFAPIFIRHLFSIGAQPGDILDFRATDTAALKESAAAEHWMLLS